jgi:hypothetical protein
MNIRRVLFLIVLLALAAGSAFPAVLPADPAPGGTALIFWSERPVDEHLYPTLFPIIRTDLDAAKQAEGSVPWDTSAELVVGSDALRGIAYPNIVSIKLMGRCDLPPAGQRRGEGPLGWVIRVSGSIQPFVYIDCDRLAEVLKPAFAGLRKADRRQILARAISHVLLHEWNHIITQRSAHSKLGLTRGEFTAEDLIGSFKGNLLSASAQ